MSELDRIKEQLVYLRFWLGIMVVTEITLVGWLISTPNTADPVLWSLAALGVILLGFGIFLLHRQIERRIEEVRRLWPWKFSLASLCLLSCCFSSALHLTPPVVSSAP